MSPTWIRDWKRTLQGWRRGRSSLGRLRRRLRLENLESRWAPAYDLTIGLGPTQGVSYDGEGQFTAEATGATIAVADMVAALAAGHDVTVSNGASGAEAGSIQWLAGSPLDFNTLGTARTLTIAADSSTQAGATFDVHSSVADSDASTEDALGLVFRAWHDLTIDAPLTPRDGTLALQADASQTGVGTLHLTGAAVVGSSAVGPEAVLLQGADMDLQSGSAVRSNLPEVFAASSSPAFLAYDASGDLYVSNVYSQTITKHAPDGSSTPFVTAGLSYPEGLAFDADGYLYVANAGSGSILKIAPDGSSTPFVTAGLSYPTGLAFGPDGLLYVANYMANSISRITPDGVVSTFVSTGLAQPDGLAFNAAGELFVASWASNSVVKVTPSGEVSTFFATEGFARPTGLTFGPDGMLYVSDQGIRDKQFYAVYRIAPTGEGGIYLAGGTVYDPQGLAFDSTGALMIADRGYSRILRVDDGGATVSVRSSVPTRPMNLGGADGAVAGINLTDAELASISAGPSSSIVFGDAAQSGDVTFTTAWFPTPAKAIVVRQDAASDAAIVLDDFAGGTSNNEPAVARYYGGELDFTAGAGGVVKSSGNVPERADIELAVTGALTLSTAGSFGSEVAPIVGVLGRLNSSQIGGDFRLISAGSLQTLGTVTTGGVFDVVLNGGDFRTRSGHLQAAGGTTLTFRGATGTQQLFTGGQPLTTVVHAGAATLAVRDDLTLTDDFTHLVGAGTVDLTGRTATIGGDWDWSGPSALSAAFSTVVLNGLDQTIRGANAFHSFTKTTTVADTLTLEAGALQSMTGVLTLQGAPGAPLAIRSTVPGRQALINPYGYRTVSRVDVRDNFNINAAPLVALRSTDSGNTTNWEVTGDPARLTALSGGMLSATVAGSYGSLPVVVTDATGRPVPGVDVTFALVDGSSGASGTFGGATTVRTNVNGIAFSPMLTAGTTAGAFRATASYDGLAAPFEFQLNNLPGAAATVVVAGGSPQSATIGTYYGTRLQVLVADAYGNPTPNVAVTFTAPTRGASGRFVARSTVVTDALGIATAPAFRANAIRGRFYVTATAAGLPAVQFELTNVAVVRRRR